MGVRAGHEPHSARFDAECDVAAIVYGSADNPDRVLTEFAADLQMSGARVAGLIQHARDRELRSAAGLSALLLPSGREIVVPHRHDPVTNACCLEPRGLARVAAALASAIGAGADLLVINRYGTLERDGGGLLRAIGLALEADIPILIAVPEGNFRAWTTYSAGMSVKLACQRQDLAAWRRSVATIPLDAPRARTTTLCETVK
jgi:hypothetical protein